MLSSFLNINHFPRGAFAVILNRRMLLAALGLSFPAVAAEAATHRKPRKPLVRRVAVHKPRKPTAAKPHAQS